MVKLLKYFLVFFIALVVGVTTINASTYVTCQQRVSTGKGYYDACCTGKRLKCTGYYSAASEKYTVMNYIRNADLNKTYSSACDAGSRNASINKLQDSEYNQVAHTHYFSVNLQ